MDKSQIETIAKEVVRSFSQNSFEDFNKLLLNIDDYLEIVQQMTGQSEINRKEFETNFGKLSKKIKRNFEQIIEKGKSKGVNWDKTEFNGITFKSEDIMFGSTMKKSGIVQGHIKIKFGDKKFSLVGVQMHNMQGKYKIKGDELRGVFKIDLNVNIDPDDMYLDEMEQAGY